MLGYWGRIGLDTRTPGTKATNVGSLCYLMFKNELVAEVVLSSPMTFWTLELCPLLP